MLWLAPAIAMACAVALFVVQPAEQVSEEQPEIILAKGGPAHLSLYRKRDNSSEKLDNNAIANKGDTVQVAYMAGESTYGAIVSVDGRGGTTVHMPLAGDGRLSQRGEVLLPRAYTLDDAPKFESFVFVAGKHTVDVKRLAALLHANPEIDTGRLRAALGGTVDIDIFTLRKDQ